jgi:hypothetical protein
MREGRDDAFEKRLHVEASDEVLNAIDTIDVRCIVGSQVHVTGAIGHSG